eukprot:6490795-Amphidinium_carterae.3
MGCWYRAPPAMMVFIHMQCMYELVRSETCTPQSHSYEAQPTDSDDFGNASGLWNLFPWQWQRQSSTLVENVSQSTSSSGWSSLVSWWGTTSVNLSDVALEADIDAECGHARTYYYGFYQFKYVANLQNQYYYEYYQGSQYHSAEPYGAWYYAKYSAQYEPLRIEQQSACGLAYRSGDQYYAYYYGPDDDATKQAQVSTGSGAWLDKAEVLRVLAKHLLEVATFDFEPLTGALSLWFARKASDDDYDKRSCYSQYYDASKQLETDGDRNSSAKSGGQAGASGASVAFWSLFFIAAKYWRRIQRLCRLLVARAVWLRHMGGLCAWESSRDCSKAFSIISVCFCDLMLLGVRRIPHRIARRVARKAVLRMRNKARLFEDAEDADDQPQVAPCAYRPLYAIQQGGLYSCSQGLRLVARRATWGGLRRWRTFRAGRAVVQFNPQRDGECLFQSFEHLAKQYGYTRVSPQILRTQVRDRLQHLWVNHEKVAGRSVEDWAARLHFSPLDFINLVTSSRAHPVPRWGNTVDLFILAELYNIPVVAAEVDRGLNMNQVLMTSNHPPKQHAASALIIAFRARHFFVVRMPSRWRKVQQCIAKRNRGVTLSVQGGGAHSVNYAENEYVREGHFCDVFLPANMDAVLLNADAVSVQGGDAYGSDYTENEYAREGHTCDVYLPANMDVALSNADAVRVQGGDACRSDYAENEYAREGHTCDVYLPVNMDAVLSNDLFAPRDDCDVYLPDNMDAALSNVEFVPSNVYHPGGAQSVTLHGDELNDVTLLGDMDVDLPGDVYLTHVLIATTGGGKRAYPFAGYTEAMFQAADEEARRKLEAEQRRRPVILVAHGSFSPVHLGHVHMMVCAREKLESEGYRVALGIMAIANKSWVQSKGVASLDDEVRVRLINALCTELQMGDWIRADIRGTEYKSYWQMRGLLGTEHPGHTFFGVWGSDYVGTTFPTGPSVCVVRQGYHGPLQAVDHQHYVATEEIDHQFSSTELRKAIIAGATRLVGNMTHPSLAYIMMGVYSNDEQERRAAMLELEARENDATDSDSSSPIMARQIPPAGQSQAQNKTTKATTMTAGRPAPGVAASSGDGNGRQPQVKSSTTGVPLAAPKPGSTSSAPVRPQSLVAAVRRADLPTGAQAPAVSKFGRVAGAAGVPKAGDRHTGAATLHRMETGEAREDATVTSAPCNAAAASATTQDALPKAMPRRRVALREAGRPPADRVDRLDARPLLQRRRRYGPAVPYNLAIQYPPEDTPLPQPLVRQFLAMLPFQEACAYVGEAMATMYHRDIERYTVRSSGGDNPDVITVHFGEEQVHSSVVSFPDAEQSHAIAVPLSKLAAELGWVCLEGWLMEYEFAFLEFGHVRHHLKAMLRNIMKGIRTRCTLCRPSIAYFSVYHYYHQVKLFVEPIVPSSRARLAAEINGLFEGFVCVAVAATPAECMFQTMRLSLSAAQALEETEAEEAEDVQIAAGGAFGQSTQTHVLANPDELQDMIERFMDEEDEIPGARPAPLQLDYDQYDGPWIRCYLATIRELLLTWRPDLERWKQHNRSPPPAEVLDPIAHTVQNPDELQRMITAFLDDDDDDDDEAADVETPPDRPQPLQLDYDTYDFPWIMRYLEHVRVQLLSWKPALDCWTQFNYTPPVATISQGLVGEVPTTHVLQNSYRLRELYYDYTELEDEERVEFPDIRPPPRDVLEDLDDYSKPWVAHYLTEVRCILERSLHRPTTPLSIVQGGGQTQSAKLTLVLVFVVASTALWRPLAATCDDKVCDSIIELVEKGVDVVLAADLAMGVEICASLEMYDMAADHSVLGETVFMGVVCGLCSFAAFALLQVFSEYCASSHSDADAMSSMLDALREWALPMMCVRTNSVSAYQRGVIASWAFVTSWSTVTCLYLLGKRTVCFVASLRWSEFGLPDDLLVYVVSHLDQPVLYTSQGGAKGRAHVSFRVRPKIKNAQKQACSRSVISLSSEELPFVKASPVKLDDPLSVVDADSICNPPTPPSPPRQVCLPVRYAQEDYTNTARPARVSHIEALREHLWHRDVHVSAQSLVDRLEGHLAAEMATPAGWVRLAQEVQYVDQCLNHPANRDAGFSSECYFLRGLLFDLAILSLTLGLNILVRSTCNLCLLCTGAEPQITLVINSLTLDFESQWGLLVDSQSSAIPQPEPVWCFAIHSQVVELFRQCEVTTPPLPQSRPDEAELFAHCSPWLKSLLMSDTVPWQEPMHDGSILLCEGGGSRPQMANTPLVDDPDDELPLSSLLHRGAASPPSTSEDEIERPLRISYFARFQGGRAEYSQPLWPGSSWLEMQRELNRAVRRRMSTWWMYFQGVPLDPEALVAQATSPYDHIRGELRRLTQPLDFPELRARGMLCVPSGPTHTGMYNTPVEAHVVYTRDAPAPAGLEPELHRLVAAEYDTSSVSGDGGGDSSGSCSATHSSMATTRPYAGSDDSHGGSEQFPGTPPPQVDADTSSADDPEGRLFNVWIKRVDAYGEPTPRAAKFRVTLERGDTTVQLRDAVRRRLKLHPDRLQLMCTDDYAALPDTAGIWEVRKRVALAVQYGRRQQCDDAPVGPGGTMAAGSASSGHAGGEEANWPVGSDEVDVHQLMECDADSEGEADAMLLVEGAGGGKSHRVDHASIAAAALGKLKEDLPRTQWGLLIEHECAAHILRTDTKCMRAVFQSGNAAQRADAFAAALGRAGLRAYAEGMTKAAVELRAKDKVTEKVHDHARESQVSATADIVGDPMEGDDQQLKKRGRPPSGAQPSQPPVREQESATEAEALPEPASLIDPLTSIQTESRATATTAVKEEAAAKKRGRPAGSGTANGKRPEMEQGMQEQSEPSKSFDNQLALLMGRVCQIEKWAHGVDDTINTLSSARMLEASKQQAAVGNKVASLAAAAQSSAVDTAADNPPAVESSESVAVAQRIAAIERAIQDKDPQGAQQDSTQSRIHSIETQIAELGQQLAPLRLRPVRRAFEDEQNDTTDEVNLNWRLGMMESTLETLSAELTVLQRRVHAVESGTRHAKAETMQHSGPIEPERSVPLPAPGNDASTQITQLHMGLNRLATMMHACCAKQQGLTEVNNIVMAQLIQLRMRCDQAAAVWGGPLQVPPLRS